MAICFHTLFDSIGTSGKEKASSSLHYIPSPFPLSITNSIILHVNCLQIISGFTP